MMRDTKTPDLFSDLLTNHMRAQQFAGFGVENSLYKTLRLPAGQRLTIPLICELTDLDWPSRLASLRLCQARLAICGRA